MAQANSFVNVETIAMEALTHLEDNLIIKPLCAVDKTADYNMRSNGHKVGDSVSFKTNPVYEVKTFDERASDNTWVRNDSLVIAPQDIRSSTRTMYIDKHYDVSVTLSAREKAMHFEQFTQEVIIPASKALAAKCDAFLATKILQGQGLYASTAVMATAADMALARKTALLQQLNEQRFCLVNPTLEATLLGKDWFNNYNNRGNDTILTNGMLGRTMGMDFYTSVNFPDTTHLNSSGTGVTVASPTGTQNKLGTSTLYVTDATLAMLAGDRIAIAGVKRPLVVKTDVTAGDETIALVDPITEIIPASAAITVVGGNAKTLSYVGAIFDNQSLAVAMPILDEAEGQPSAVVSENGVSIRVVMGYDMSKKISTMSFDLLIGAFALDPRRITLLANAA